MLTVYKITNLVNNKCYIGSSSQVYKRWNDHVKNAYRPTNACYNYPLQCAIRKYGEKNFKFEILKQGFKTRYECEEYEHDMIIKHQSMANNWGYNQTEYTHTALSDPAIKAASIQKISQKCAKVDYHENIIEIYKSYHDAARANGCEDSPSSIRDTCKGTRSSVHGAIFRDLDENDKVIHKPILPINGSKKIIGINIENPDECIYFDSVSEAARLLPASRKNLSSCISGSSRFSVVKGYIFRALDIQGNIIPNEIDIQEKIKDYNKTNPLINGERHTITEWCKIYNISTTSYYKRRKKGMDVVTALTTPRRE